MSCPFGHDAKAPTPAESNVLQRLADQRREHADSSSTSSTPSSSSPTLSSTSSPLPPPVREINGVSTSTDAPQRTRFEEAGITVRGDWRRSLDYPATTVDEFEPHHALQPTDPLADWAGFRTSLGVELAHPEKIWNKGRDQKDSDRKRRDKTDSDDEEGDARGSRVPIRPRFNSAAPDEKTYRQTITYWNYIHPEVLASLQTGREGKGLNHHDEHLFILVHQTFELWFKQVMFELDWVRDMLIGRVPESGAQAERDPLGRGIQRLERAERILRLSTEGFGIMETMDPCDFLEFRDWLTPASGFQSIQFRELEILMGLKDEDRIMCAGRPYREAFVANKDDKTKVFDKRLKEPNLREALETWLAGMKLKGQDEFLTRFLAVKSNEQSQKQQELKDERAILERMKSDDPEEEEYIARLKIKNEYQQQAYESSLIELDTFLKDERLGKARTAALMAMTLHGHRDYARISQFVAGFLKFEQAMLLWRNRHARMIEMFIGRRTGTGGSTGVDYIDATASKYRVFNDLWKIRSLAVAAGKLDFDPDKTVQSPLKLAVPSPPAAVRGSY